VREEDLNKIKRQFGIVGNAKSLNRAIEIAVQVASTDLTVLITGESGTGKESFSKIIHNMGHYKHGKFIAINCGAMPEGTIDSELFGHKKGSFTGALEDRKGYFEEVDNGTMFLDEIGELPLGTQARLLRVLEYGEFIKVGSSKVQKVKVRLVAATNVNLVNAVENGEFREDLYYRLSTVPIVIPPLRERIEDIYFLFCKFSSDFADKYNMVPIQLTQDAQDILRKYYFPGNIRQLKNIVEQISALEMTRNINKETLLKYLPNSSQSLPVIYRTDKRNDKINEREILYKVLLDMKQDMYDLKSLIFKFLNSDDVIGKQLINSHSMLFKNLETLGKYTSNEASPVQVVDALNSDNENTLESNKDLIDVNSSFSIELQEKELIYKALKKYRNRKTAAESLGISERTLYRKINQYDLE